MHSFDESLVETVVQKSINPIEKVERSMLIMASTLHQLPAEALVNRDQVARLTEYSPGLFPPARAIEAPPAGGAI
jgi:hypothetical protein